MIGYIRKLCKAIRQDERGLTAVEYAVLGGIIVIGIAALSTTFTDGLDDAFGNLFTNVTNAQNGSTGA
ncbi:Flp family type IVb pilin [Caenibius sp. WL]|uniref:Flp family type IVb pilin n=1 Tax=Caenibius sp. WL TaxID=2872646 RepID=UPI001C999555|nr:Flp family type IVb pilin [Caenibius sp. WL]QZP08714.1 Flp family type IVb pilin [Caenibius sp. WL]